VALLGVRGYYRDTMGKPGVNDRAIYDDAIVLVSDRVYRTFNANCDPGAFRKDIANLVPGIWLYKVGTHGWNKPPAKRYTALVQYSEVAVHRDGWAKPVRGFFGINIHKGSRLSVSSLGCQTLWPGQWDEFISTVREQLEAAGRAVLPYVLVEEAQTQG